MGDVQIRLDTYVSNIAGHIMNYSPEIPKEDYGKLKNFVREELSSNPGVVYALVHGLRVSYLAENNIGIESGKTGAELMHEAYKKHGAIY